MGVFVSVEALDSLDRTVHIPLLTEYLVAQGQDILYVDGFNGTEFARRVSGLMGEELANLAIIPRALLDAAVRSEVVGSLIRPALQAGRSVICEGYLEAAIADYCYTGGLPTEYLQQINEMATGALKTHRTIILDTPVHVAQARRTELAGDPLHPAYGELRMGYYELAAAEPRRIRIIDASQPTDVVQQQLRASVMEIVPRRSTR